MIYHVKCKDCDHDYVGETARALGTKLKEHQNTSGHSTTPDNVKVILGEDNTLKRKIKETIKIKTRHPYLNRDGGLELPNIYDEILLSRDHPEVT